MKSLISKIMKTGGGEECGQLMVLCFQREDSGNN